VSSMHDRWHFGLSFSDRLIKLNSVNEWMMIDYELVVSTLLRCIFMSNAGRKSYTSWHSGMVSSTITLALLFICSHVTLGGISSAIQSQTKEFFERSGHTNNWAVLVCTSRFWFNYRHVANVLSLYHSVKRLGIPDRFCLDWSIYILCVFAVRSLSCSLTTCRVIHAIRDQVAYLSPNRCTFYPAQHFGPKCGPIISTTFDWIIQICWMPKFDTHLNRTRLITIVFF
jgi:hypothetical protein